MKKKKKVNYNGEQLAFLDEHFKEMGIPELTLAFNAHFSMEKTEGMIRSTLKKHNFTCGRKGGGKGRYTVVSAEQAKFIQENYTDKQLAELLAEVNEKFGISLTLQQLRSFTKNHGIKSGLTGHFRKGMKAWNTGTKGKTCANSGSFRKGQTPVNTKPIAAERVDSKSGHILVKIQEENPYTGSATRFKHKHVVVWEEHNGPVPKGMFVRFVDGNPANCELENLMLVSRQEHLHLNRKKYRQIPKEIKPSVLALTKLEVKVFELQKR